MSAPNRLPETDVMTRCRPLFAAALMLGLAHLTSAADRAPHPAPGDPTEGHNGLDEALQPLAQLNLRPDFSLNRDQKRQVQAIRDAYADHLTAWRTAHAADFQQQFQRWSDLRSGRPHEGGQRPTQLWAELSRNRQQLLGSSPDPADAVAQVEAELTPEQRRRFDAATNGDLAGAATAPFAAEVLPLPPDGVPRAPGFYKLRIAARVPSDKGTRSLRMTYVLFLPHNYDAHKGPYPALVFLHGSGEVGTDGAGIFADGLGPAAELRQRAGSAFATNFPMILVCPQCPPRGQRWDDVPVLQAALQVLDDAGRKVRIDPDRVYATGLSMGGKGAWLLAGQAPDRFAAIAPLAASTLDLDLARRLKDLSVWTVNGSEDIEDGAGHEQQMAAANRDAGGDGRATILAGEGHGIWQQYYSDPAFYQWFLTHKRLTAAERAARVPAATQPTTQAMR